jgi:hypothetical protein
MKLISIETQIIQATVNALRAHGYLLGVNDGEVTTIKRSVDVREVLRAMRTTDEDYLLVYSSMTRARIGWVRFIYGNGNDGLDVISDYTVNLEPIMVKITEMINEYEEGGLFS